MHNHIVQIQHALGEVKQAYEELRSYETPDRDTRCRVDTRDAVSQKIIKQVQRNTGAKEDEKDIEKRSARWSEVGSVFTSTTSQSSTRSSSVRSSHSSKLSVKRQEAAAELAAMEATLKMMEEMECEREKLGELEFENKERLAKQEAENAEAQRRVYEQELNSDEEISDLLHDVEKIKDHIKSSKSASA